MSINYFFNKPEPEEFDDPEVTEEDYTKVYEPSFEGEDD